jgi:hypothetical protein
MIRTAALVLPLALGAVLLFQAGVAFAEDPSVIQISAVLASKEPRPPDPRLDSIKHELESLPYYGYTQLDINSCRFQTGDQCGMDIPGGGYLQIRTTEATSTHLKMRLLLIQENRPILNADVKLNRNAGLLLRSKRTETGTIILSIKAPTPPTAIGGVEREVVARDAKPGGQP